MDRRYSNIFRISFAFLDLFALNLINLALLQVFKEFTNNYYDYIVFCIFNNMVWLICSYTAAIYINNKIQNFERLFRRTLIAFITFLVLDNFFILFYASLNDKLFILYSIIGFFIFLVISRLFFKYITSYLYSQQQYQKKIVFIGYNKLSQELILHFKTDKKTTIIEGFFDDGYRGNDAEIPMLGKIVDCMAYAKENKITEIYSTLSPKAYPYLYHVADTAEQLFIRFKFIPDLSEFINRNCYVDFIEDTPILSMRHKPLESLPDRIKKRCLDIIFSGR